MASLRQACECRIGLWAIESKSKIDLQIDLHKTKASDLKPKSSLMKLTATGGRTKTTRTVGQRYQSLALMLGITLIMFGGIGSRLAYLQLLEGT